VQAGSGFEIDWRDAAAYAPLLGADRYFFAWEWLRRDPKYRSAARDAAPARGIRREDPSAAAFGLVGFECPRLSVPNAQPLWRADVHPSVLSVERGAGAGPEDAFAFDTLAEFTTLIAGELGEHLLLSDGLRALRLDAGPETFGSGPLCLRYRIEGLFSAEPQVLTLRRVLVLCRTGGFARSLHPLEPRARRWILMLRAWDALCCGANQREIAQVLLSRSAAERRWRSREPSVRSQAQRLVRSASAFANGGYRVLLAAARR
jgi:hypothetical protein